MGRHLRLLVVMGLAAAMLLGVALIRRPAALRTYTTPVLDAQGTRVRLAIPRNWQAAPLPPAPRDAAADAKPILVVVQPRNPTPGWLQRLLPLPALRSEPGTLRIALVPASLVTGTAMPGVRAGAVNDKKTGQLAGYTAFAQAPAPDGSYLVQVEYFRTNRTAFEKTFKPILQHIEVLRTPTH